MAESDGRPDRYKSFSGIDCMGDSRRLVAAIRRHIDNPAKSDAFWEAFKSKLEKAGQEAEPDELRLICSYIYYIEDLFERCGDSAGLELLQQLEEQCC